MEMVWCQSCKTVIWAYDHAEPSDRAGVANSFNLPCPLCNVKGNFNGLGLTLEEANKAFTRCGEAGHAVYDKWSYMKFRSNQLCLTWNPSGDNSWFRPNTTITLPVEDKQDSDITTPKWTILYNMVSPENGQWIGTGWEFFDDESDAQRCYERHNTFGDCATKRPYHRNDRVHLGAGHRLPH